MGIRASWTPAILVLAWLVLSGVTVAHAESHERLTVREFVVEGPNSLTPGRTSDVLDPFVGQYSSIDPILRAADALQKAIRDQGRRLDRVTVPPQNLTRQQGVVTLKVTAVRVGDVSVEGQDYFSRDNILRSLPPLKPDTPVNVDAINQAATFANRHPAKDVSVQFSPGDKPQRVAATVQVDDQSPHQVALWANNTGTEETGEYRVGASYGYSNLFGLDHEITLSFSGSPEKIDDVYQYGVTYRWPFYSIGSDLFLFAFKSTTDSGVIADVLDVSGKGTVLGARFTHYLPKIGNLEQQLQIGFQSNLFDNNVDFLGIPLGVDIRSQPLSLRYSGTWSGESWRFGYYVGANFNVRLSNLNDDATYAKARVGADASWQSYVYGATFDYWLKQWIIRTELSGQYTDEPLISGEQFGLGGYNSVRGFEGREVLGDRGIQGSLEVWTPAWLEGLRFLAFVDAGHVTRLNPQPGEYEHESIASTGIGLRYWWHDALNVRLDYGYVLNGLDQAGGEDSTEEGDSRVHFGLSYQF